MFCTQCGTPNPDTVTFCQRCGRPMEARRGPELPTLPLQPQIQTSRKNAIKQQKNRGYVVAGAGTLLALFAFYFLPFATYLIPNVQFEIGVIWYDPISLRAVDFDQFTQFSGVLTFITLLLAVLLTFRENPFGLAKTSIMIQRQRTVYAMLGMSGLSILIYLGEVVSNINSDVGFSSVSIGFWLYLLGVGVVIVGSVIGLRMLSSPLPSQTQQKGEQPPTLLPPQSSNRR